MNTLFEKVVADCVVDSKVYSSKDVFQEELEKVFDVSWLLLGHTCEIQKVGDFFCSEIGCRPVIVRNAGDTITAYIDECVNCHLTISPRSLKGVMHTIHCTKCGQEYSDGPKRTTSSRPRLREVKIDTSLHGIIFGAYDPKETLTEFLGPTQVRFWKELVVENVEWKLAGFYVEEVDANWKIFMQPGDGYHVPALHEVFSKYATPQRGFLDVSQVQSPRYSNNVFPYPALDYESFNKHAWGGLKGKDEANMPCLTNIPEGLGGYVAQIFPNTVYSTRNGWDFLFQMVSPRSPTRCLAYHKLYTRAELTREQIRTVSREEDLWWYPMGLNFCDDQGNFEWQQRALAGNVLEKLLIARYWAPGEDNMNEVEASPPQDGERGYRSFFSRLDRMLAA